MTTLECEHCGCEAIESAADGLFTDGEGGKCITCGFPGLVSVDTGFDEDVTAWWSASQDALATCDREDCDECDRRTEDAAQ